MKIETGTKFTHPERGECVVRLAFRGMVDYLAADDSRHLITRDEFLDQVDAGTITITHPTIHLQGYGRSPAIAYGEIRPGDVLRYNYGATATVTAVEPVGTKTVRVTTRDDTSGREWTTGRRHSSLIGLASRAGRVG